MKKFKYYLFDFDGTLIDSFPSLYVVFKRAYEAVGITIKNEDVPYLSRVPLFEGYERFNAPNDKESIEKFSKAIVDALDSEEALVLTELFHDSLEFFYYVETNNIPCGIVTSNRIKHVKEVLDYFSINPDIFKVIVGNELTKKTKPDPEPVNVALKLLNYQGDKKDIVYVGDSYNDCLAGINAGVSVLLLDRGDNFDSPYPSIKSLMELFNN